MTAQLFRHSALLRITPTALISVATIMATPNKLRIAVGADNMQISLLSYQNDLLTEIRRVGLEAHLPRALLFETPDRIFIAGGDNGQL
jgi:hypothetical protein